MISSTIFSMNRPCQLDLTIRTITKKLPWVKNISVVYRATEQQYIDGYNLLIERLKSIRTDITFIQQGDFRTDLINIFESNTSPYILCFNDDDVVLREALYMDEILEEFNSNPMITSFSLRLSDSLTNAYYYDYPVTPQPDFIGNNDKYLLWDWTKSQGDWGYPHACCTTIFKRKQWGEFLERGFSNPPTFEGYVTCYMTSPDAPYSICHKDQVAISTPMNRISGGNMCNMSGLYTIEKLNEYYLNGQMINDEVIYGIKPNTPHFEVEFEFVPWSYTND
jgi:hypothetical protein